jgi:hypothetical protein
VKEDTPTTMYGAKETQSHSSTPTQIQENKRTQKKEKKEGTLISLREQQVQKKNDRVKEDTPTRLYGRRRLNPILPLPLRYKRTREQENKEERDTLISFTQTDTREQENQVQKKKRGEYRVIE